MNEKERSSDMGVDEWGDEEQPIRYASTIKDENPSLKLYLSDGVAALAAISPFTNGNSDNAGAWALFAGASIYGIARVGKLIYDSWGSNKKKSLLCLGILGLNLWWMSKNPHLILQNN